MKSREQRQAQKLPRVITRVSLGYKTPICAQYCKARADKVLVSMFLRFPDSNDSDSELDRQTLGGPRGGGRRSVEVGF